MTEKSIHEIMREFDKKCGEAAVKHFEKKEEEYKKNNPKANMKYQHYLTKFDKDKDFDYFA